MDSKQKKKVLIIVLVALFVWAFFTLTGPSKTSVPISTEPLHFDAGRAYHTLNTIVTQYPIRIFGSLESRPVTGYLRETLEILGYEWDYVNVGAQIKGKKEVGRDILGYREGMNPEIIAIVAHYDTAPTTIQGAMDNGSGVAVLIEIARILAENPTQRSLLIVFTDGGEWGMAGAKELATRYSERSRIVAVLSLDHVAVGNLDSLHLEETGLMHGFTPPWYHLLALASAEETGLPVQSPTGLREHLERTFYIPWSDQGPFLASGIPAINLGSESVNPDFEKTVYHSTQDTIENIKVSSIESFGFAAERIIRSIDELPAIPKEPMDAFRIGNANFVPSWILQAILFLSLPLCILFHIKNHRHSFKTSEAVRELVAYLATFFPLLMVYILISFFRFLKLLPVYDLYPATVKDPILLHPYWGVLSGVIGTALVIAGLCAAIYMYAYRKRLRQDYASSKIVLLILMLMVVLLALLYNSYWAATFLALPGWFWCLTDHGSTWNARLLHWIIILGAIIPCGIVFRLFASHLGMEQNFVWYQILALNTGLFTASGYFLGAAAAALGIRFMAIQLHTTGNMES